MQEKIFVGKVKTIQTKFGEMVGLGLSQQDREKLEQYTNQEGWCNILIMTNREGKKYATIDTYSIGKTTNDPVHTNLNAIPKVEQKNDINLDEIPF